MSTITIKSCRNATEKLSFEWPDRLPDTTGEFVGLVTCDVINPRFPRIRADQITWAVDNALRFTNNDGTDVEEVVSLISLKDWLNYAQLEINAPDDEAALAKSKQVAKLEVQMKELKELSLSLQGQVAERGEKLETLGTRTKLLEEEATELDHKTLELVKQQTNKPIHINDRQFEFGQSKHVVAIHHAKHPAKPSDKEQEIRTARTERSKVCTIL